MSSCFDFNHGGHIRELTACLVLYRSLTSSKRPSQAVFSLPVIDFRLPKTNFSFHIATEELLIPKNSSTMTMAAISDKL